MGSEMCIRDRDNQDWMDDVTSGDYQGYYEEMYKRGE